jgi:sporulation protein YlmC with PRC-barrel domain
MKRVETMKASDLKGMAVISLGEGTKLGEVDQPLFDLPNRRICALHVKGDSGIAVLPFEAIERIGDDAITVVTSRVTQTPGIDSSGQGLLDLEALRKLKIVNQDGTFLGKLSDVEFDPRDGQVTHLAAHKGGVLGMGGTTTPIGTNASLAAGREPLTVYANAKDGESSADLDAQAREGGTSRSTGDRDIRSVETDDSTKLRPTGEETDAAPDSSSPNRPPLSPDDPWPEANRP